MVSATNRRFELIHSNQHVTPAICFELQLYVQLLYIDLVNFDWDDSKEESNIKKHGVDFW